MGTVRRLTMVCALLSVALGLSFAAPAARGDEAETIQHATDLAVTQIRDALDRSKFPNVHTVAVVPLRNDPTGYATNSLANAVTQTHYHLLTRSDATWKKLLAEIEWGVRREDVMDPATVQKFGKIQGVDAILYGVVDAASVNLWNVRARAKISVRLADVETGQELWGTFPPAEGTAYMHWSDALTNFWRYPVAALGVLVALVLLLLTGRALRRAIGRATRPL